MIKKIETYIGQEPWDEALKRQDKWIDIFCWAAISFAVIYFGPVCIWIFIR